MENFLWVYILFPAFFAFLLWGIFANRWNPGSRDKAPRSEELRASPKHPPTYLGRYGPFTIPPVRLPPIRSPYQRQRRGPRSYVRSDERILEDINDRLIVYADFDVSEIEVKCEQGKVTLSGRVDSRRDRKNAERLAQTVSGVTAVTNELEVRARRAKAA